MNNDVNKPIELEETEMKREAVPLILPDDFDLPPELEERILKEMAELNKELDEKEKKRTKRKGNILKIFTSVASVAAVVALFLVFRPLHNHSVNPKEDIKDLVESSSDSNQTIENIDSNESVSGYFYTISDTDFKGGIAHGDKLYIIPSGNKDGIPIKKKVASVTNTGREWGRDYFHVSITDSNRIVISVDNYVIRHAHLYVEIYYEDGSVYENEWDLITGDPRVRFNPPKIKKYVGDVFVPQYYVVVVDENENVKTVNYMKDTDRIIWYTDDSRYVDDPKISIDENGTITCLGTTYGYTTLVAKVQDGGYGILSLKIAEKPEESE